MRDEVLKENFLETRISSLPDAVDSGVTISDGPILGAEVIVLKDVKPWMIVVGKPVRESKRREILNDQAIGRTGTVVSAHPSQE